MAYIVPNHSRLAVDAKVSTTDRDQIYPGMSVRVRFTAFSQRATPELFGKILRVASDQSGGTDNVPVHYAVRVDIPEQEIGRLKNLKIVPGMPAEVMMTGYARTVLSYLTKPLTDQFTRAFREN